MSIYASWLNLGPNAHEEGCAVWLKMGNGLSIDNKKDCTCGLPRSPIAYQGSHILPSLADERGGWLDIASIPNHITREAGELEDGEGKLKDFLRLYVNEEAIILTRDQVKEVRDALSDWLERESGNV